MQTFDVEYYSRAQRLERGSKVATALRFADIRQFELCMVGGRMTQAGFDRDGDLRVDEPNDPEAVTAVQRALADLGYDIGVDGSYGPRTASVVQQFKIDQDLQVPPGLARHDGVTGPGTSGRLDELFSNHATVRLLDEYGRALPAVGIEADGVDRTRVVTTDGAGAAVLDQGGPWALTLEPTSTLEALGDLLDRPWPPDPQPEADAVTTPFTDMEVTVTPGDDLTVVVAARLQYEARLPGPLDGTVQHDDDVRLSVEADEVTVALQANGGFPVQVRIVPVPADVEPPPRPDLVGWVPPNGYVVRDGDTTDDLAELFLHDPERFAELSDHEPVPGETIFLPDEAVPGWLSLATDPLPPQPEPREWFQVVPDDVLRAFYTDADPAPLHDLLAALAEPPDLGAHPAEVQAARVGVLAAILASPEILGPERPDVDTETEVLLDGSDD